MSMNPYKLRMVEENMHFDNFEKIIDSPDSALVYYSRGPEFKSCLGMKQFSFSISHKNVMKFKLKW